MLAIGFDPSLRAYGFCVYDSQAQPHARRVASGHEGTLPETVPVARFMHFRSLVSDLLRRYRVDVVGIESPAYCAGPFSEQHFGLMMYSLEAVFEQRKDCVLFDPATLKSLTVGKGNAGKSDIQRFVQMDTMTTKAIDNNEADAYCIAREAARFVELRTGTILPQDLTKNEQSVFLTKSKKRKRTDGSVKIQKVAHIFRENSRFFEFSRVPAGSVALPTKSSISQALLDWLENT